MTLYNMFQATCKRRKYLSCEDINAHIQKDTCTYNIVRIIMYHYVTYT